MIPGDWQPHHRPADGELVGYLRPVADDETSSAEGTDGVIPVTLFGYPLGRPSSAAEAGAVLDGLGLSVLADRWSLEQPDGETVGVRIVEVTPERVRLTSHDLGRTGSYGPADLEVSVPDGATRLHHLG